MDIEELIIEMIEYSNGNLHDINHFLKVYSFARAIGKKENLIDSKQTILEISALVHDIACPYCREKYGNTNGKYQEKEGEMIAKEFLLDKGLSQAIIDRVVFLVAHHHTYDHVDDLDYQILLEADYLVNACESNYSPENIKNASSKIFKTKTGIKLLKSMYHQAFV